MSPNPFQKDQQKRSTSLLKYHPEFPFDYEIRQWTTSELVNWFLEKDLPYCYRVEDGIRIVLKRDVLVENCIAYHDVMRRHTPHPVFNPPIRPILTPENIRQLKKDEK